MSLKSLKVQDLLKKNESKLVIGFNQILKSLQKNELEFLVFASNSPENLLNDLDYYNKFSDFNLIPFTGNSDDLRVLVKKPFLISFVGVLK